MKLQQIEQISIAEKLWTFLLSTWEYFTKLLVLAFFSWPMLAAGCASFSQSQAEHQRVVSSRQLTQQGIHAMQRGNWEQAEKLLKKARINSPYDVTTSSNYAETLWNQQRQAQAIAEMKRTIQLSGEAPEYMVRLGNMYLSVRDYDLASDLAKQAIHTRPNYAPAWKLQGDIAYEKQQITQAGENYLRAISYDPQLSGIHIQLARIYRIQGRPNQSLICLRVLENQLPAGGEPAEMMVEKGHTFKSLNRYEEAAVAFSQAAEIINSTELQYEWAYCEMLSGRLARAQWIAQGNLAKNPQHLPTQELLTQIPILQASLSNSVQR